MLNVRSLASPRMHSKIVFSRCGAAISSCMNYLELWSLFDLLSGFQGALKKMRASEQSFLLYD
jgi:hypothetical protein